VQVEIEKDEDKIQYIKIIKYKDKTPIPIYSKKIENQDKLIVGQLYNFTILQRN
jgi:hypothetical protein